MSFLAKKNNEKVASPKLKENRRKEKQVPNLLFCSPTHLATSENFWHPDILFMIFYDDSGCDRRVGPIHHVTIGVSHYVRVKHELRTMFLLWNQSKCMRCTFYCYQMIPKIQLTPSIYLCTQVSKFERGFVLLDPVRSVLHELQKYLRIVFESGEVSLVAREKELSFTWF